MFPVLLLMLTTLGGPAPVEGRVVQMYGRGFSFQVAEPSGWALDTRAAPQIANFIFHRQGENWRESNAFILARFVKKQKDDTLQGFIEDNLDKFVVACPAGKESDDRPDGLEKVEPFHVQTYDCPGVRREVVATGDFSHYFVVFVLSSERESAAESALPALQEILSSFRWFEFPRSLNSAGDSEPGGAAPR
jgi:hypothetical protein